MSIEEDIYTFRHLPWVSKSTVLSDSFCEWQFYLKYILRKDTGSSLSANTGTNIHAVVGTFFKRLDILKLQKIPIDYEGYISEGRIYQFMLRTCMEMIPPKSRDYVPYKICLQNFSLIEADHWISLNKRYKGNVSKVLRYFLPAYVEKFMDYEDGMLFGTIDRKNKRPSNKKEIIEILDYKTGHVPKMVKDYELADQGDEYSWTLPTDKMFELHFYSLLDMIDRGYTLDPDIRDFMIKPEFFVKEPEMPMTKKMFFHSDGTLYDFTKYYRVGIIYLGDESGPYIPKKKSGLRSMRAVFRRINRIRGKVYRREPFLKNPNYFKCRRCSIVDMCLNDEEKKMFENESAQNV